MQVLKKITEIRDFISRAKSQGKTIAFVPTMGALHQGHLELVTIAKNHADICIASIFVNPTQFGKNEDFSKYPRTENEDIEKLKSKNCDVVFIPEVEEIYTSNIFEINITKYTDILCGKYRVGHFNGVAQVVLKLFNIVAPHFAIFGEKDFQQVFIIKKLIEEFNLNIEIITAPTIRDVFGLALSSRNKYLSEYDLQIARKLNVILKESLKNFKDNQNPEIILKQATENLISQGFTKIDYLEFRNSKTLEIEGKLTENTRVFFAGYIGNTRLIDNIKI
jgi:pantoate--beta-alanine ligase